MTDHLQTQLAPLAAALRSGRLSLSVYLDQLEARFAAREAELRAFIPESNRFERLRREAAGLAERFPDPQTRPPSIG